MTEIPKDLFTTPDHDVELNRSYEPDVVLWQLTPLGTKRINEKTLPSNLPLTAMRVLDLLHRYNYAEEDEIAYLLDASPIAIDNAMKRLSGFGYVQSVQYNT